MSSAPLGSGSTVYFPRQITRPKNYFDTLISRNLFYILSIKNILIALCFFIYTFVLLFVSGGYSLDQLQWYSPTIGISYRDTSEDYDVGCNGYSMEYRIQEQRRILQSVRSELVESSKKLDDINMVYEELNKKIPERQIELNLIKGEIESAERMLAELRDRRNVRVYLPHEPLFPKSTLNHEISNSSIIHSLHSIVSWEEIIDFSRCSISSFMCIYVYPPVPSSALVHRIYQQLVSEGNIGNSDEACLYVAVIDGSLNISHMDHWNDGRNHIIINVGESPVVSIGFSVIVQGSNQRINIDPVIFLRVPPYTTDAWKSLPPILPFSRKFLLFYIIEEENDSSQIDTDLSRLKISATASSDTITIARCKHNLARNLCTDEKKRRATMRMSIFCVLPVSFHFTRFFWEALQSGCIPIVLSIKQPLPFEEHIDWRLATYRLARTRFPELHFILKSFSMADILEMRRRGRIFFQNYLADDKAVVRTLLASLRSRLNLPAVAETNNQAIPLFNTSFTAPILTPINSQSFDDEFLGPLEAAIESPAFLHNFSFLQMYSYKNWNLVGDIASSPEFLTYSVDPPSEVEFYPDSNIGYRPIEPGSGIEFSKALGGNRAREQFTVVILTYNRDAVLSSSLERLHKLPYLNRVIVVWNNVDREPIGAWPRLHVPVEFIKVSKNSLNNRFIPWDRIQTEAILSLDDDIDLKHHEIVFAFRVWRENRERLVGFPARYHARFGDSMFYNSNHTCQMSIILTGAAFLHKAYLHAYHKLMPEAIIQHVDDVTNCEDIAMNFLVSHITRKPPIKTTSKWTLRCPTCMETLSQDESHFQERHECIRLFTKIYGYNPLKFSQFRADSILFKTRLPADKQKCFKYV